MLFRSFVVAQCFITGSFSTLCVILFGVLDTVLYAFYCAVGRDEFSLTLLSDCVISLYDLPKSTELDDIYAMTNNCGQVLLDSEFVSTSSFVCNFLDCHHIVFIFM